MPVENATNPARMLAKLIEPVTGQVYFSPECHTAYQRLGFEGSPGKAGATELPNGPAYFTSRGSVMGQVPGQAQPFVLIIVSIDQIRIFLNGH